MAMNVQQLMSEIAQLPPAERLKLLQQTKALVGAAPIDQIETHDDLFALRCICDMLRDSGTETFGFERYKKHAQWRSFCAKVPAVLQYVRQAGSQRVMQRKVLTFGLRLLYKQMTRDGYPVTGITMLAHFHRVPAVLEQAFPGYAKSGLLGLIFKGETKNNVRQKRNH